MKKSNNSGQLPKERWEKDMNPLPCGGGKYNKEEMKGAEDLKNRADALASYVKSNRPKM